VLLVTHDLRESAYLANRICVMSARPGRILETRDVGFARPRTLESSYAPEFAALVQQLRMRIAEARRESDAVPPACGWLPCSKRWPHDRAAAPGASACCRRARSSASSCCGRWCAWPSACPT
jgi:ABC-type dipeptide/oligopeptide/nickel transport system ATPase component